MVQRSLALASQPVNPGRGRIAFDVIPARGFNVSLEIETIETPLLVDVFGDDFSVTCRGLQELNVVRIQFTFQYVHSPAGAIRFFSA